MLFFVANAPNHIPGLPRKPMAHRSKHVYLCLSAILVSNACDVATNPGPHKFPCTICKKAVHWTTPGVCCDTCDQWFHRACMGMNTCVYEILASNNVSWQCCRCGMSNFSSSFFDSTISEHTNPFSILSPSSTSIVDSRIGEPIAMSSPRSQYSNIQPQTSAHSYTHSNSYKLQITCQYESRAYQPRRLHQSRYRYLH